MNKEIFKKQSCKVVHELRDIAKKENFSLLDVAKFCDITKARVHQIFNKVTDINFSTLLFIANAMNYDIEIRFKKRNSKNQTVLNFSDNEVKTTQNEIL